MNTYLLPLSADGECWIERVYAKSIKEAEDKFVNLLAEDYMCIAVGDTFNETQTNLISEGVTVGEIYDIEEF